MELSDGIQPRPSSTGEQPYSYATQAHASPTSHSLSPAPAGTGLSYTTDPYQEWLGHEQTPPPPPPLPLSYMHELKQQYQQPTPPPQPRPIYSSHPSTHYYDPGLQYQYQSSQPPLHGFCGVQTNVSDFYVPKPEPESLQSNRIASTVPQLSDSYPAHLPTRSDVATAALTAPALGSDGPSDWEHFAPGAYPASDAGADAPPLQSNISLPGQDSTPQNATSNAQRVISVSTLPTFQIQETGVSTLTNTTPLESAVPAEDRAESCSVGAQTVGESMQPRFIDVFADLDPWFRSSLERFVAMLRTEAVADADEERFKIFASFVTKETKLREVMYNIEKEAKSDEHTGRQPSSSAAGPTEVLSASKKVDNTATTGADVRDSTDSREQPTQASEDGPPGTHVESNGVLPTHTLEPLTMKPPQPIYIPFHYSEGPQRGSDSLTVDRPSSEAYSALRQASNESGRAMATAPPSPAPMADTTLDGPRQDGDDGKSDGAFIGLIREKSLAYRKKKPAVEGPAELPPVPGFPDTCRPKTSAIEELRVLTSMPLVEESEFLRTVGKEMHKYSDSFGYIKEASSSWEGAARERRKQIEDERVRRQEESEENIDGMFNEKQIGYADINTLEEDFRQTEARVQLEEERREVDNFIANVADPLDERLATELIELRVHYDTLLSQLSSGTGAAKSSSIADRHILSETMKMVMSMYPKLESRYQKRLDIGLDRERRRKKAERRPHVFIGDSAALKRLDREFDQMELRNIFVAAKDRDDRTNSLMDAFDAAIMHGLGENQSLLDQISAKLKKFSSEGGARASGMPNSEIKQILKTLETCVGSLCANSESILRSFGLADSALNDADYSVAVAESQYALAAEDVFRRLKNEKKQEDAKIRSDFESKLKSIRAGPAEIVGKVEELLGSCEGSNSTPALPEPFSQNSATDKEPIVRPNTTSNAAVEGSVGGYPADTLFASFPGRSSSVAASVAVASAAKRAEADPEHQERIRKALEDAKRRNAARASNP